MQLDTLDYKIIAEALYHIATDPTLEIDEKAMTELSDSELENRLLCLRQKVQIELNKRMLNNIT